ncbi:MAG: hypothetical protein FD138_3242 [Planctomycetota bacterium]|nr:MAG: hypothetical protein FD138_3242 [Planctomycetota bacterium]
MSDTPSHEVDRSEQESPSKGSILVWLCGGLGIYVGVFLLILLDEAVFRTYFVSRAFPQLAEGAQLFFLPLIVIASWFGWVPSPVFP